MHTEILNALRLGMAFVIIFGLAELLFHLLGVRAEITRKFTHTGAGLLSLAFPLFLRSHYSVLLLCAIFALFLWLSMRFKFMPSINAVDRFTHGSLLFPLVVYLCFYIAAKSAMLLYFYLPILILAISDPLAALAGKSIPIGPYLLFGHSKTMLGSTVFFTSALACSIITLWQLNGAILSSAFTAALVIATATTLAEAATHKGYDNLLIPATAVMTIFLLRQLHLI